MQRPMRPNVRAVRRAFLKMAPVGIGLGGFVVAETREAGEFVS